MSSLDVRRVSVHCSEVVTCHLEGTAQQQICSSCQLVLPLNVLACVRAGRAESLLGSRKAGMRFWPVKLSHGSHTCQAVCCQDDPGSVIMEDVPAS